MIDRLTDLLGAALASWRAASLRRRTLAELSRMSDAHLDDIGLTRGDLMAMEAGETPRAARPALRLVASRRTPAVATGATACCKAA